MWPQSPFFFGGWGGQQQPQRRRTGLLSRSTPLQSVPQEQPLSYGTTVPGGLVGPMGTPAPEPTLTTRNTVFPEPISQMQAPRMSPLKQAHFAVQDNRMPLLALGAGLLDVAEGNGTYSGAAQGFMGARDSQDQRALQQEELGYMRGERTQQQQERDRAKAEFDRIVNDPNTPPDVKAAVRAAGISGLADIMQGQVVTAAQKAETEARNAALAQDESQFSRQLGFQRDQSAAELGIRRAALNAEARPSRGFVKPTGRDAMIYQQYEGVYSSSQQAIADLDRTETLIRELATKGAMGQPLDAAMRMRMNRLTSSNPEARAAYEQLQSQVWPVVLKNLEGLAPVTQVELGEALSRTVNADMTPEAAIAEIARMRRTALRAQTIAGQGLDFTAQGGSYATGRNEAGQTWRQALDAATKGFEETNRQSPPPPPTATAPARRNDLAGMIDSVLNPAPAADRAARRGVTAAGQRKTFSDGFTYEKINDGSDDARSNWRRIPNGR